MEIKRAAVLAVLVVMGAAVPALQAQDTAGEKAHPPTPQAVASGNAKDVVFNWMWYTGMIRGLREVDSIATLELQATGTIRVNNQPCTLQSYRESVNYLTPGMRVQYTCTTPDGQTHKNIEVVSGNYAWDEDVLGAGLEPGRGTPKPNPAAVNERLIRIWASSQGGAKAAAAAGQGTKVAMEGGKAIVTFPLPGLPDATANATLSDQNQPERVQVRQGNVVTEFTYSNYGDWNPEDDKVAGYTPGHIVEKRDGVTIMDLTVKQTEVGNLYVVMPVPDAVRTASVKQ